MVESMRAHATRGLAARRGRRHLRHRRRRREDLQHLDGRRARRGRCRLPGRQARQSCGVVAMRQRRRARGTRCGDLAVPGRCSPLRRGGRDRIPVRARLSPGTAPCRPCPSRARDPDGVQRARATRKPRSRSPPVARCFERPPRADDGGGAAVDWGTSMRSCSPDRTASTSSVSSVPRNATRSPPRAFVHSSSTRVSRARGCAARRRARRRCRDQCRDDPIRPRRRARTPARRCPAQHRRGAGRGRPRRDAPRRRRRRRGVDRLRRGASIIGSIWRACRTRRPREPCVGPAEPAADRRSHRRSPRRHRRRRSILARRSRSSTDCARPRHGAGGAPNARASARLAELEAASLQTRIRELDRRLYGGTVRNPAELMEMQRELERCARGCPPPRTMRSSAWSEVGRVARHLQSCIRIRGGTESQRAASIEPCARASRP